MTLALYCLLISRCQAEEDLFDIRKNRKEILQELRKSLEQASRFINTQKRNLVLEVSDWDSGFFSCFRAVIGALDYYENNKASAPYESFQVKFLGGLYLDPFRGPNWWEYYFEPIVSSSDPHDATPYCEKIPPKTRSRLAYDAGSIMPAERSHELIQKYIRIKPHIQQEVNAYVDTHFKGCAMIGIHYRGTDKITEAPRVPYEQVYKTLRKTIANLTTDTYKIFVATDEQAFLDDIGSNFKNVICYDCLRSANDTPLHYSKAQESMSPSSNPYERGKEALIDCLLLAKCHILIRTQSNLSSAASDFNPFMVVKTLNNCNDRFAR